MASVWNYPVCSKFTLTVKSINKINKIDESYEYSITDVFTKINKPSDYYEWPHGNGDIEFFIESDKTKKAFRVYGSNNSGTNFKHYKALSDTRQLPLKVTSTMFLETFSILGILEISTFEEAILFKSPGITEELQFPPELFSGVNDFTKSEINSILVKSLDKPKAIIHKSIDLYYEALSKFEERYSLKHLKTNTSDVVLIYSNHTKEDLFNALSTQDTIVETSSDGMITLICNNSNNHNNSNKIIKFKQVSLKLSPDGARLGRITSVVKNLTNMNSVWNPDKSQPSNSRNSSDFSKTINRINNKVNKLKDIVNTKTNSDKLISLYVKETDLKETSQKHTNLTICNDISLECLIRLVPIIKAQGAHEHVSSIVDVMRRGSTTLPVVISYSSGESEVLNSPEILNGKEPVIITIHPSNSTHYVINMYYLIENTNDPVYVKIQMTNAGGDTISWKVEGNTLTTYSKIMNSVK